MKPQTDQEEIRRQRRQKLIDQGLVPYPARTNRQPIVDVRQPWQDEKQVIVAGRVQSIRIQGGSAFIDVADETGRLQAFLQTKNFAHLDQTLDCLDRGDFLEIQGRTFTTKRGELTVDALAIRWLAKALRPLPTEHFGLEDIEQRYRWREVDLNVNPETKSVFLARGKMLQAMRQFLTTNHFLEVETPVLHPIAGGATARPFVTHHNSLDTDLFLRVAPELYLKRLIVGGLGRVFEVGRNFRNEGIDRDHNPEFTMMECYAAFTDYEWMMDFTENLVRAMAEELHPTKKFAWGDHVFDLTKPFARQTYDQILQQYAGVSLSDRAAITKAGKELIKKGQLDKDADFGKTVDELFKTHARPKLIEPVIVYDYPAELSPLAKKKASQPDLVEMFQLLMGGTELAKAFSELNDPVDQRQRFAEQEKLRAAGDEEAQRIDEAYIRSLEYGMPPTSGMGLGIDRLTALLTNQKTLKDVMLFPTLRPERP